jgi:hypothetical protein
MARTIALLMSVLLMPLAFAACEFRGTAAAYFPTSAGL